MKTKIVALLLAVGLTGSASAAEITTVKSFYYGNSFTGNAMPGLHPLLGKSAGKTWEVGAAISAGVPIWSHMKGLMDTSPAAVKGLQGDYDVVVGQIFAGEGLAFVTESMWQGKVEFDKPTDVGDIAALTYVFKEFLKAHPQARAYIYTSWPTVPGEELATQLGVTSAGEKKNKKGYDEAQMEKFRRAFNYEKAWLADYDPKNPKGKTHTRAHMYAAMEGVKKNLPELWAAGRLGMIPVGDVFLAVDKKMRAGQVPGLENVGPHLSNGHLRSGLSRYTLGATFYSVLFKEHPGKLDRAIYNERSNYDAGKFGFYVHQPDLGEHVEITPERKRAVDDAIWEVVSQHSYTGVKNWSSSSQSSPR